ncbi:MAG: 2-amino-4-hydroxy-6-hydroxymethyldihydropteridine diphosphokinase [Sulfurospirillum sp.]|nr:MAG: 2-amino-4-hydroxy-6-hydroxymethyldihydropteridine diphosphokinase [Sulfurospirillum sp.]
MQEDLRLYFLKNFPSKNFKSFKKHCATIGVGGNTGDVIKRFKKLFYYLQQSRVVDIICTSAILKNPPFGYLDQPYFFNTIIIIKTNLPPQKLMRYLLFVEKRFKRIRNFKDSPRTLDLDMIFYDKISISSKHLTLPHPHWFERESVTIPLGLINCRCN